MPTLKWMWNCDRSSVSDWTNKCYICGWKCCARALTSFRNGIIRGVSSIHLVGYKSNANYAFSHNSRSIWIRIGSCRRKRASKVSHWKTAFAICSSNIIYSRGICSEGSATGWHHLSLSSSSSPSYHSSVVVIAHSKKINSGSQCFRFYAHWAQMGAKDGENESHGRAWACAPQEKEIPYFIVLIAIFRLYYLILIDMIWCLYIIIVKMYLYIIIVHDVSRISILMAVLI